MLEIAGSQRKSPSTLCFLPATLLGYSSDSLNWERWQNKPPTSTIKLPTSKLSNNHARLVDNVELSLMM